MSGLILYAYLFLDQKQDFAVRGETAVNTSALILRTAQGSFLDKEAEVNSDVAPRMGFQAPEFAFEDLNGSTLSLSDLRGKPVLLNFWATWCPPCRKEIPDLQRFHEQYGDQVTLLGINWGEERDEVRGFLARYGATYTNLMDEDGKFFVLYRLTGLPTSYWIDEEGSIRGVWLGAMDFEDMVEGFVTISKNFDREDSSQ